MPEPWVSSTAVLKRLANFMGGADQSTLAEKFLEDCQIAAVRACGTIRSIMKIRGWKPADIESWDDRIGYADDLATYFAAIRCVGLADYNMEAINALDCRKYLQESPELSVSNEPVAPAADATIGGAAYGTLTVTTEIAQDCDRLFR